MVLCIQDRTYVWLMQRPYNLCVQMEKEQDHSHTKEFEYHHMQLLEYSNPLEIFGIHHVVWKDTDWSLGIPFSIFLGLLPISSSNLVFSLVCHTHFHFFFILLYLHLKCGKF